MLTDRELRAMRETQESAFPALVNIRRRVLADDGFGGVSLSGYDVIASDVPARITQAQLQAYGQGLGRDLDIEKWIIRLPHGSDLRDEDVVDWGDHSILVETVKQRSWATAVTGQGERLKGGTERSGD